MISYNEIICVPRHLCNDPHSLRIRRICWLYNRSLSQIEIHFKKASWMSILFWLITLKNKLKMTNQTYFFLILYPKSMMRLSIQPLSEAVRSFIWIHSPELHSACQSDLPVGFLLFRYSVLFTVESLSLLYLLVISWFICFRRWCIDKLGVFHANQISMCLDPHLN